MRSFHKPIISLKGNPCKDWTKNSNGCFFKDVQVLSSICNSLHEVPPFTGLTNLTHSDIARLCRQGGSDKTDGNEFSEGYAEGMQNTVAALEKTLRSSSKC